jgi:hypothetical protein
MEILSKRLDRPLHEITKRGGESWIALPTSDAPAGEEN